MKTVRQIEAISMKRNLKNNLPKEIIQAIYKIDLQLIKDWINRDTVNFVDTDNRSAIFHAILIDSIDVVSLLLESAPDLNIKDSRGWYPLHYAVQNNLLNVVDLLIKQGAMLEAKDDYGNTPLWRAVFASEGRGEIIKLLLLNGADPNNANSSGITPYKLAHTIANYNVKQFFD